MKILVTGGSGFIGSHLVEALLANGHEVLNVDNLSTGRSENLSKIEHYAKYTFVNGDIKDKKLLKRIVSDCDVIFHLAAVLGVKHSVKNPLKVIEGNMDGTKNLLELALSSGSKVIFASTSEVYGKNKNIPFHENSDRLFGPATKQRWSYATAKSLNEHLCFAYSEKGLPVTVIRYFNAYGPRATASDYGGVIPKFISSALKNAPITVYGSGEQERCFSYIDDTIKGTISCLSPKSNNMVFNIGNDRSITINKLATKIKKMTSSSSPIIHVSYEKAYGKGYEDTLLRVPDISKARKVLDFHPVVDIDTGLKRTIDWFKGELT